jgi:hypothetical protein
MAQFIITESQLEVLKSNLTSERGKSEKQLDEAWYNTVMDIVGLADPTGVVDIVNGISYFTQGDTLFGILSIVSAIPYAGDIVAKPVMGALKLGSASTKTLQSALKTANKFPRGTKEYDLAIQSLENLAKSPNVVGKFLQSAGGANGWAFIGEAVGITKTGSNLTLNIGALNYQQRAYYRFFEFNQGEVPLSNKFTVSM